MEGRINFTESKDKEGKKPHFKGFVTIGEEVHEFAVWPARTGNGWSGTYKPKRERADAPPPAPAKTYESIPFDDEIAF